jgi:hypothetical protein
MMDGVTAGRSLIVRLTHTSYADYNSTLSLSSWGAVEPLHSKFHVQPQYASATSILSGPVRAPPPLHAVGIAHAVFMPFYSYS